MCQLFLLLLWDWNNNLSSLSLSLKHWSGSSALSADVPLTWYVLYTLLSAEDEACLHSADEQTVFISNKLVSNLHPVVSSQTFIHRRVLKIRADDEEAAGCFTLTALIRKQEAAAACDLNNPQKLIAILIDSRNNISNVNPPITFL